MIENMNQEQFLAKLKEMVCLSDWHRRYYTIRARKYKRIDYWIKTPLGTAGVIGAIMAGTGDFRVLGALLAGVSAFVVGTILPNVRWDSIVSGLKEEEEEWTRIFYGYEGLLNMTQILDRDEMLAQEWQKVEEWRRASALNDRHLPEDKKLLKKLEAEVRAYYKLDNNDQK